MFICSSIFVQEFGLTSVSQDSVVRIAPSLRAGQPRSRVSILGRGKGVLSPPNCADQSWGRPMLLFKGYIFFLYIFPRELSGRDMKLTNYPQSSVEVKNVLIYTSILPYAFMEWTGKSLISSFFLLVLPSVLLRKLMPVGGGG
jgi:hypothetical protein